MSQCFVPDTRKDYGLVLSSSGCPGVCQGFSLALKLALCPQAAQHKSVSSSLYVFICSRRCVCTCVRPHGCHKLALGIFHGLQCLLLLSSETVSHSPELTGICLFLLQPPSASVNTCAPGPAFTCVRDPNSAPCACIGVPVPTTPSPQTLL